MGALREVRDDAAVAGGANRVDARAETTHRDGRAPSARGVLRDDERGGGGGGVGVSGSVEGGVEGASDADCELPADAESSWVAVDAAFAKRAQLAPGTSGRACVDSTPYDGDSASLPWTALYGQLSGYLDCARRAPALGLPLVSIATAGEFTSLRTESGDVDVEAPARVYAATDSALVHALLVKEGDEGAGDLVVFGNVSSGTSDGA